VVRLAAFLGFPFVIYLKLHHLYLCVFCTLQF
jgi:hypothetical protein